MTRPIFPEFIINKLKIKYNFNADVFLINNEYSNEEIYNYILTLNFTICNRNRIFLKKELLILFLYM